MAEYQTKLIKHEEIAEGTMAFYFEKPTGFVFKAGQTIDLTLLNPPETDAEGNKRTFSLVSAPHEEHLAVATRLRNTAFKRVLQNLPTGTEVSFKGPFGSFTLHNDATKPAVFLMGGIGITPVRSIILDATNRSLPYQLFLFYSNRRPEDAAFLPEFTALAAGQENFTFVGTMTEIEKSNQPWSGETGYIDQVMLKKYLPNPAEAIFYLAGPAPMVAAMRKLLDEIEINSDNIRTEEFSGY